MSFWKPDLLKVDWQEEEKLGKKKKKKKKRGHIRWDACREAQRTNTSLNASSKSRGIGPRERKQREGQAGVRGGCPTQISSTHPAQCQMQNRHLVKCVSTGWEPKTWQFSCCPGKEALPRYLGRKASKGQDQCDLVKTETRTKDEEANRSHSGNQRQGLLSCSHCTPGAQSTVL